jgi:hypothetical protein
MPAARECFSCGRTVHPRNRHGLCPECNRAVCNRCRQPLPEYCAHRVCSECRRTGAPGALDGVHCRECGAKVKGAARRDLCSVCKDRFCTTCDQRLAAGRRTEQCPACTRAAFERHVAKKNRRCAECGVREPTARGVRCSACNHQIYLLERSVALKLPPGRCRACRRQMPCGRRAALCTGCLRKRNEQLEKERSDRRCATCRDRFRAKGSSYCKPCEQLRKNWTHAVHKGDKLAALVRPVAPRRKWQVRDVRQEALLEAVADDQAAHP